MQIEVQCNKQKLFTRFFTTRSWSLWKKHRKKEQQKPRSKLKNNVLYLQRIFALPAVQCKWQLFAKMY